MGTNTTGDVGMYLPDLKEPNWDTNFALGLDNLDLLATGALKGIRKVQTATDGDATPDVTNAGVLKVSSTAPTSITSIDGGFLGQELVMYFSTANTSVVPGPTLSTKTGRAANPPAGGAIVFCAEALGPNGLQWRETGRSFVDPEGDGLLEHFFPAVQIVSWPSSSTTSFTTVSLAAYGVPPNVDVLIKWYATTTATIRLHARSPNTGDSDLVSERTRLYSNPSTAGRALRTFWIRVGASSEFEMKFGAAFTGTNSGYIDGYFKPGH